MSSIRRARSPAKASVEAGPPTTSGAKTGPLAQAATSVASVSLRSSSPSLGGMSNGAAPPYCSASSANANSSSSMSPSATMRGSTTASAFNSSRKISRAIRPARRVGRYSVACASLSGFARASNPSTSLPSTNAAMTVRKNGTETGTLNTRMRFPDSKIRRHHGMGSFRARFFNSRRVAHHSKLSSLRTQGPITTDVSCGGDLRPQPGTTGPGSRFAWPGRRDRVAAIYATLSRKASSAA